MVDMGESCFSSVCITVSDSLFRSYVVAVNSIDNLTDLQAGSRILYGSGDAEFTLQYSAIVMKPFKGEVVDAIVDKVGKVSSQCS
jgi:DNA-directed RNA polymerase subunit E'/Rpb7